MTDGHDIDARRRAVQRQRRYRQRAMAGRVVVHLETDIELVERLVAAGLLRADQDEDREQIAAAILAALDVIC